METGAERSRPDASCPLPSCSLTLAWCPALPPEPAQGSMGFGALSLCEFRCLVRDT